MGNIETNNVQLVAEVKALRQRIADLEHREERLRRIYEAAHDAIFVLDPGADLILEVNPQSCQLLGYTQQELCGMRISAVHPEEMPLMKQAAADTLRLGFYRSQQLTCTTKDGRRIPTDIIFSRLQLENQTLVLAMVRDTSEQKRAEETLEEMAAFAKLNPAPVLKLDRHGTILLVNQAAQDLFSDQPLLGESWYALCPGLDEGALVEHEASSQKVIQQEALIGVTTFLFTYRWSKEYEYIYVYGTDLTEHKRLETQLRHTQKMDALGTLAGGIAHDFNNILAAITGYTELVKMDLPQGSLYHNNLQQVLIAGARAKALVQQILVFSYKGEQERTPVGMHAIIEEALALLRATFPATITIHKALDPTVCAVLADPTQMHQVVVNLCANAEYAMRQAGGVLEVRLEEVNLPTNQIGDDLDLAPGSYVCLMVRDTGGGMPREVQDRIFEPFFTTKSLGQGSGMGLAVIHGIIARHDGAITVDSTPGHGTTFKIYLPGLADPVPDADHPDPPILRGNERILFVDDEESLATLGQEVLSTLGYHVVARTSGSDALATFLEAPQNFDVVVTDQTMPDMTGETLAREMLRIRPNLPIILCTGFSYTMTIKKANAIGVRSLLMKPFQIHELARTIRQVLDRSSNP